MAYQHAEDFNDQGATGPCRRDGAGNRGSIRVGVYAGTGEGSK